MTFNAGVDNLASPSSVSAVSKSLVCMRSRVRILLAPRDSIPAKFQVKGFKGASEVVDLLNEPTRYDSIVSRA